MKIVRLVCALLPVLLFAAPLHAANGKPDGDMVGAMASYTIKAGDGYPELARKFDVSLAELVRANPDISSAKKPKPGTVLSIPGSHIVPQKHEGIVLNLAKLRLFYFAADGNVYTYPVAVGREGWETPLGETTVIMKRKNPVWTVPESIRAEDPKLPETVPAGPDNPLGAYAISLGWPNYAIHGTNHPYAVGKRTSHGCIRLYPEDIEALYKMVEPGLKVTTVNAPYEFGWQGNTLYLSAVKSTQNPLSDAEIHSLTLQMAQGANVDWDALEKTVKEHTGIPVAVGKKKGLSALFR